MSLPRTNYLANITQIGYDLISAPVDLSPVLSPSPLAQTPSLGNGTLFADFSPSTVPSNAIYLELNVTSLNTTATLSNTASANVTFLSSVSGESLSMGQFLAAGSSFFIHRGLVRGFDNPFFTDKFSATPTFAETWTLAAVLDRSVLEVFLMGGQQSATLTLFPEYPLDTVVVRTAGLPDGAEASVKVWGLESGWARSENGTGTVAGNVTMVTREERLQGMVL